MFNICFKACFYIHLMDQPSAVSRKNKIERFNNIKIENRKSKIKNKNTVHYRVIIKGIVQGVGFRPFVYQLAKTCNITGSVLNSSQGVIIEAEGKESDIKSFLGELKKHPPVLSRINYYKQTSLPPIGYTTFEILKSHAKKEKEALVPPDIATCEACNHDIFNPHDNHYQYPFTNCTNCGPRFTIIKEIPYDRLKTSMNTFEMCDNCREEYRNPLHRRFHAQPVACPKCGPHVEIVPNTVSSFEFRVSSFFNSGEGNWLEICWEILAKGKILALKGIGGFHLVCDAKQSEVLKTLRYRKGREAKPFAVMCRDIKTVRKYCFMNEEEARTFTSPEAPIVILRKKPACDLPEELAPKLRTLGVMLPYSPLHLLLFSGSFDILVMTSGNYSELPLVKDNNNALTELGTIADYFLFHNREIVNRCDDSIVQVIDGEPQLFRRSRGYVPYPVHVLRQDTSPTILGVGGEMKNNFCLLKKDDAFLSQYIGEIDTLEGEENLFTSLINFQRLIGVTPEIVAYDAHPDYASARIAHKIEAKAYVETQHHHAHLASCMAENGLDNEETIGVILDGTGYGTDGCLWGFEILTGNYIDFRRRVHLAYVPLPGGEIAIRQSWRSAVAYLMTFLGNEGKKYAQRFFKNKDIEIVEQLITSRFNTPLASGCGRLFDAVSALLGICLENTYEGQAAIELGEIVLESPHDTSPEPYHYEIKGDVILPGGILKGVIEDRVSGVPVDIISTKFHLTLANIICDVVKCVSTDTGIRKVVLSGGTWQNQFLFKTVKKALHKQDYEVLYHRQVPPNDGGIALGQVMIAHWKLKK